MRKQRKLQDEILVVDLETTCFEDQRPETVTDIIEIGVAHLDVERLTVVKNWGIFVKNGRTMVTPYCTNLNGITQEQLNLHGLPIQEALRTLEVEESRARTWASWGNFDRKKLEMDTHDMMLRYPMSPRHINVKTLFTILYNRPKEPGMDEAIQWLHDNVSPHWQLKGRHHSGKDDANNIALILAHLIGRFRDPLLEAGVV